MRELVGTRAGDGTAGTTAAMSAILRDSLLELSELGRADDACRLAARACAVLRRSQADEWHTFNKLLHKLSSRSGPVGMMAHRDEEEP
jgi:hypothetical protein